MTVFQDIKTAWNYFWDLRGKSYIEDYKRKRAQQEEKASRRQSQKTGRAGA